MHFPRQRKTVATFKHLEEQLTQNVVIIFNHSRLNQVALLSDQLKSCGGSLRFLKNSQIIQWLNLRQVQTPLQHVFVGPTGYLCYNASTSSQVNEILRNFTEIVILCVIQNGVVYPSTSLEEMVSLVIAHERARLLDAIVHPLSNLLQIVDQSPRLIHCLNQLIEFKCQQLTS